MSSDVLRLKPLEYIHVVDHNLNITVVRTGPLTFTPAKHEGVVAGPLPFVVVPSRHYCIIKDPVARNEAGEPLVLEPGFVLNRFGETEVRQARAPFPLYPGESLVGSVRKLALVPPMRALLLRALRDFTDADGNARTAGEEYQFHGPATYVPRVEEMLVEPVSATVVKPNHALRLRARRAFTDRSGVDRVAGEQWLWTTPGAYMPDVDEEVDGVVEPVILHESRGLHLLALHDFTDDAGHVRSAGHTWLVTRDTADFYLPGVNETVTDTVDATVLAANNFAVVCNPVDPATGLNQLGAKVLKRGPAVFFLHPGESLAHGIQEVYVLQKHQALLLKAVEVVEGRQPGEIWMVEGPCEYVPPLGVTVVEQRAAIPLNDDEGVYVRNIKTGEVRSERGRTYMLTPEEELWQKTVPAEVEELLAKENGDQARDLTRVVTLQVRHNSAVQIYDYKADTSRVEFGPCLVMLEPDEQITVWSLSGSTPKRPHVIKSLALRLGPEFMTDVFVVETSDHAKLRLRLSYNWEFRPDRSSAETMARIFSIPDFVGDTCKAMSSRVRGAVATQSFDTFHRYAAKIIRTAVFGTTQQGKVGKVFRAETNDLCVTNVDIKSVEPVDQRTRDSLVKSVQQAIEITTKSQEAKAQHLARKEEQRADGARRLQKLADDAAAEKLSQEYIELRTRTKTLELTGEATADAEALAKAQQIEAQTDLIKAETGTKAAEKLRQAQLETKAALHQARTEHAKALQELRLKRKAQLAVIEAQKQAEIIGAIGRDTIAAMARAGPELQARLLKGLGIKSVMITDGSTPVNLWGTAAGLIGGSRSGGGGGGGGGVE